LRGLDLFYGFLFLTIQYTPHMRGHKRKHKKSLGHHIYKYYLAVLTLSTIA